MHKKHYFLIAAIVFVTVLIYVLINLPALIIKKVEIVPDVFIAESWLSDEALEESVTWFNRYPNVPIYIAGHPIPRGSYLLPFKNNATVTSKTLIALGIPDSMITVLYLDKVNKDRTYDAAKHLYLEIMRKHGPDTNVLLLSSETHSARSYYIFSLLFDNSKLGVFPLENSNYNPENWLSTSDEFKTTINEVISIVYSYLFFHPEDL